MGSRCSAVMWVLRVYRCRLAVQSLGPPTGLVVQAVPAAAGLGRWGKDSAYHLVRDRRVSRVVQWVVGRPGLWVVPGWEFPVLVWGHLAARARRVWWDRCRRAAAAFLVFVDWWVVPGHIQEQSAVGIEQRLATKEEPVPAMEAECGSCGGREQSGDRVAELMGCGVDRPGERGMRQRQ